MDNCWLFRYCVNGTAPLYALLVIIGGLLAAPIASAEQIVLRLVDAHSGAGEKNCEVNLLGGSSVNPRQMHWLTQGAKTASDGRASFNILEPLASFVSVAVYPFDCRPCDLLGVLSADEILRTGVMAGLSSADYKGSCRPNPHKLEGITAKAGEIVLFVRKATFGEKFFQYH
jgi:hypothetical protein